MYQHTSDFYVVLVRKKISIIYRYPNKNEDTLPLRMNTQSLGVNGARRGILGLLNNTLSQHFYGNYKHGIQLYAMLLTVCYLHTCLLMKSLVQCLRKSGVSPYACY